MSETGQMPGQSIHEDGDDFVNEVRFHQDANTTNYDGEGNACHHSKVGGGGGMSSVAEVKPGAPGHGTLKTHGGAESAHHMHHSKHASKPHHGKKSNH